MTQGKRRPCARSPAASPSVSWASSRRVSCDLFYVERVVAQGHGIELALRRGIPNGLGPAVERALDLPRSLVNVAANSG